MTSRSVEPRPRPPRLVDEAISIACTTLIATLALVYTLVPNVIVLVAWEVVALAYLTLLLTVFRNRATRDAADVPRALRGRLLEALTWTLPIAASITGGAAAVTLLTTESTQEQGLGVATALLGAVGVVIAWALLQAGFAEIYESVYERLPEAGMIAFPTVDDAAPTLSDFLYMAFTVGTSFAVAGATVASRKVRRVVIVHSVTSFFYNTFLIAVAIQVIQRIISG